MNREEKLLKNIYKMSNSEIKKLTPFLDEIQPKLTIRQRKYAIFYALSENGSESVKKAGYKVRKNKSEEVYYCSIAWQNNRKIYIKQAIEKVREEFVRNKQRTVNKLFKLWENTALFDPSVFFNPDGSLKFKTWKELPEEYRQLISGMKIVYHGKDCQQKTIELEFLDRKYGADKLDKFFKITNEKKEDNNKNELTDDVLNNLLDKLNGK